MNSLLATNVCPALLQRPVPPIAPVQYLAEMEALENKHGAQKLPFEKPLVNVRQQWRGVSKEGWNGCAFDWLHGDSI